MQISCVEKNDGRASYLPDLLFKDKRPFTTKQSRNIVTNKNMPLITPVKSHRAAHQKINSFRKSESYNKDLKGTEPKAAQTFDQSKALNLGL